MNDKVKKGDEVDLEMDDVLDLGPVEPEVTPTPDVEPAADVTPAVEPALEPAVEPEPTPTPTPAVEPAPVVVPLAVAEPEPELDVPLEEMEPTALAGLIRDLRGQLSDAAAGSFFGTTKEPADEPATPAPVVATPADTPALKVEPAPLKKWEDQDFLGETKIDAYLDDRDKLNSLLNAVARKAIESGAHIDQTALRTDVLRGVPEVVGKFVSGMLAMRTMANEFYETNTDLKPYRNIVAAAANNLSAQNADWTMGKVITEAAVLARKTLGLRKVALTRTTTDPPPSARPGGGTRRSQTPAMTGVQREIEEVLNLE